MSMLSVRCWLSALTVSVAVATSAIGQSNPKINELLPYLPATTNAIAVLDVKAILDGPRGQVENLRDDLEQAAETGLVLLPEAELIVVGSELNGSFEQDWIIGTIALQTEVSTSLLARAERGYVEIIGGRESVWTPRNAYEVKLDDRQLGVHYPADRQDVARWINSLSLSTNISFYLQQVARLVGPESPYILAVDLKDAPSPRQVEERLQTKDDLFGKRTIDHKDFARRIASILGASMTVSFPDADKIRGKMVIEFQEDITPLAPFAKALVLDTMSYLGAQLEELERWKVNTTARRIILEGELSPATLRRLTSLLTLPTPQVATTEGDLPKPGQDPTIEQIRVASQKYFNSIETVQSDLYDLLAKSRNRGTNTMAIWMQRFSTRIDQLPVLHVDPELLDLGRNLSKSFLDMGQRLQNVRLGTEYRNSSESSYGYYGYGYYNVPGSVASSQRRQNVARQEMTSASAYCNNKVKEMQSAIAETRQQMTQKYQVEF